MAGCAETRLPVTMRLPRREVELVSEYAREAGVTKTEAFLHYLRLGLQSADQSADDSSVRLASIERSVEEILRRLAENAPMDDPSISIAIAEEAAFFPAIKQAILFGSYARGDAVGTSDVDVRLVIDRKEQFNLYDLARFQKAVERRLGLEVDVITADDIKDKNLADAIRREGILVYER